MFEKGYGKALEVAQNNPKYYKTCFNCAHYQQTEEDEDERCQNEDVLRDDMIIQDNTVYCIKWKLHGANRPTAKEVLKKRKK